MDRGHRHVRPRRPRAPLAIALGLAAVIVVAVVAVPPVRERLDRRALSDRDGTTLVRASDAVIEACIERLGATGGDARVRRSVAEMVRLARDKPRRTTVSEGGELTPRGVTTNIARSLNGECWNPVPGGDRLRVEAIDLANAHGGRAPGPLRRAEIERRLRRVASVVRLERVAGPKGLVTYRARVQRRGTRPLALVVSTGPHAPERIRAFARPLIPGVDNRTVEQPGDGTNTGFVIDTHGLRGAPFTDPTDPPKSARQRRAQRTGDLRDAAERALLE